MYRDTSWIVGWAIGRFFFDAARVCLIPSEYPWWLFPEDPGYEKHKAHAEEAQAYFSSLDCAIGKYKD